MPSPDYRYTTRFAAKGHVIQPTEVVANEARASLDQLRGLLPEGLDPETHPDLLFVAANLAVAGVANQNDDGVSIEDCLATYRRFEWKLCDIEHDRQTIKGFILKAGLSELGTNRLITEDEARAANAPFNIATLTVLWKVAGRDLCSFIETSSAAASPDKDALSLSFEVGFNDYDIAILPKGVTNLSSARIIESDSPHFDDFDKLLRVNKGKGVFKETGERVTRILSGKIVPLGEGIVTVPAAAVKGLLPILSRDETSADEVEATEGPHTYSCAMVNFPEEHACAFRDYAASIPDAHLYNGEEGTDSYGPQYGRETTPHITALYGIKTADASAVQGVSNDFNHIEATMGSVSTFEGKDYDVLKCDVDSPHLHALHHRIKAATDCHLTHPTYNPHVTIAYIKKGTSACYVGDQRFAGKKVVFPTLTFSSHAGDKTHLPLKDPSVAAPATAANASTNPVYPDTSMNRITMSQGWQERFASFKAKDPLVNAVTVTLSDGRVISGVHVFDGTVLEFDKTVSTEGVVITDMTPGNPPQVDTSKVVHPHAGDVIPVTSEVQQAKDAANLASIKEGQQAAYTDATTHFTVFATLAASLAKLPDVILSQSRVSPSTQESHSHMNLDKLNQSVASLQKAIKPEDKEAVANVAFIADEIAKISEQFVQAKKDETARTEKATAAQLKSDTELTELKATVAKMEEATARAEAEAKFQAHMASVTEVFDLDDETLAALLDEIKACDTDELFAKFMDKSKKVMKEKTKEFKKKQVKADDDMTLADKKGKKDKAAKKSDDDDEDDAKAALEAIASAKDDVQDTDVNNNLDTSESLAAKYQRVFGENTKIDGVKVKKILKRADKAARKS